MRLRMKLKFSAKSFVMGVLNVTPDSFSDGNMFIDRRAAVKHAVDMAHDGADIIDVGGESTRPGSRAVSADEELKRVLPVIKELSKKLDIPISIDTQKSAVAGAALKAGASIVNDVSGLRNDPDIAKVAAEHGAYLILMHMKGTPQDMQRDPSYKDVIGEIIKSLQHSIKIAHCAGVPGNKIIIDPGIGFGKRVEHNLEILARLGEFKKLGYPICIGTSRKSFIGKILKKDGPKGRLYGTLATSAAAIMNGANIVRVHDVGPMKDAALMIDSILKMR